MTSDRYDRGDYNEGDPANFQKPNTMMLPLEKILNLWGIALGAKAQEICGYCGAKKSRQCDREGNIINEPICPDCGM